MCSYTYHVSKYTFPNDDEVTETELERETGLSFLEALDNLKSFVRNHEDGHLTDYGGYTIEYESADASLSAFITLEHR